MSQDVCDFIKGILRSTPDARDLGKNTAIQIYSYSFEGQRNGVTTSPEISSKRAGLEDVKKQLTDHERLKKSMEDEPVKINKELNE